MSTAVPPVAGDSTTVAHVAAAGVPAVPGHSPTHFIGSFVEGADQALLMLRGDIVGPVVERVSDHIEALRAMGTRILMIDAAAVDSYDAALLALLGRTQRRLGRRRGLLRVRGLHPALVPDQAEMAPAPGYEHCA